MTDGGGGAFVHDRVGLERDIAVVIDTSVDVVVFPARSRATAEIRYGPLGTVVEFHENEYGATVSSAPMTSWPASSSASRRVTKMVTSSSASRMRIRS